MKIYALMTGDLVLYIGSTTQSLAARAATHRCGHNTCTSKYIPKDCEWEIVLLDTVPDNERAQWERHYYDTLNPLYNERVPGRSQKEWVTTNTDHFKAYQREYYQRNKEAYHERTRKYRASK
jgi:predicted GIY-YIG superfamily endonuclease